MLSNYTENDTNGSTMRLVQTVEKALTGDAMVLASRNTYTEACASSLSFERGKERRKKWHLKPDSKNSHRPRELAVKIRHVGRVSEYPRIIRHGQLQGV